MLNEKMIALGTARSVIRELFEYGNQRAAIVGRENVFDFSLGNPSVPAPAKVNETIMELCQSSDPVQLHGYTSAPGAMEVRQTLADSINRRHGTSYTGANLFMTCGAAASLTSCLHGLCNPGDEVVVIAPYFPEYKVFIEKTGAEMVMIPADIEAFQIQFEELEARLTPKTKALIVNSPNNPSGAVYSEETIVKLAALLTAKSEEFGHPIYLLADEPYREIVFDGTVVPYVPKYYPNTLVCYSYSKSLSLPGERIGYIVVPDECADHELVFAACAGAARAMGYVCAPSMMQLVVAACAEETADISVYAENRRLLMEGFKEMGIECVAPGGTFYIFPRSLEPDDVAFSEKAKSLDLLVVPGSGFGCPGHVRISHCVPTERIVKALPVFKKLVEMYK